MAETKIQNNDDSYQGIHPTVFKKLDQSDVNVAEFQVFKQWTILSGSSTASLLPLQGIYSDINALPILGSELTYNDAANIDGSLQSITYFSINHLYYTLFYRQLKMLLIHPVLIAYQHDHILNEEGQDIHQIYRDEMLMILIL